MVETTHPRARAQVPVLLRLSTTHPDEFLKLTAPQFPRLENGDNNTYLSEFCEAQ